MRTARKHPKKRLLEMVKSSQFCYESSTSPGQGQQLQSSLPAESAELRKLSHLLGSMEDVKPSHWRRCAQS